jgi:archaemetzincin
LPKDALVGVGILDHDIFTEGLNFIFGQGSLTERAGVYSFYRFTDDDFTLYKKRCFRLVSHEIGHVLSLEHCVYYECVMNGANSLEEDDGKPLHLCPVCHAKLKWNVEFDDVAREKALVAILEREKIADELAWHKARLARVEEKAKKKDPEKKDE